MLSAMFRVYRCLLLCLTGGLALTGTFPLAAQQPLVTATTPSVEVRPIDPGKVALPPAAKSAKERRFSFIVYGDTRGPADGQILQPQHSDVVDAMLRVIGEQRRSRNPVRFVVQTGDAVLSGRNGQQWNVSYTPLIERLIQRGGVPYFFAVGNHDVGPSPNLEDPVRRVGLANTVAAMSKLWPAEGTPARLSGYPTFSFAYGHMLFIAIDSNIVRDPTQLEWVTATLRSLDRTRYPLVAIMAHHPALSSGPHGGDDAVEPQSEAIRQLYLPLMRQYHVRLFLAGHDHLYDHYIERYADETGPHRIDHILTGGGGAPIYRHSGEPDLTRYAETALPAQVTVEHAARPGATEGDNPHHFVLVEVTDSRLRLRLVSTVAAPFRPYGSDSVWLE